MTLDTNNLLGNNAEAKTSAVKKLLSVNGRRTVFTHPGMFICLKETQTLFLGWILLECTYFHDSLIPNSQWEGKVNEGNNALFVIWAL